MVKHFISCTVLSVPLKSNIISILFLGLQRLKHRFPLVIDDCNVNYINEWYHSLDAPCSVVSCDLPYGLNRDSLEIYLGCKKIKIKAINEDDEGSTITVELDDSAGK